MNDARARQKEYGDRAKALGTRLDDLAAIESLDEAFLLPGHFEPLSGDLAGQYSMRLSGNWRLILEPANNPIPRKPDGGHDLKRVTAIRILGVVDYHKK